MKKVLLTLLMSFYASTCSEVQINQLKTNIYASSLRLAAEKYIQKLKDGRMHVAVDDEYVIHKAIKIYMAIVLGDKEKYAQFHTMVNTAIAAFALNNYKEQYADKCDEHGEWVNSEAFTTFYKEEAQRIFGLLLSSQEKQA